MLQFLLSGVLILIAWTVFDILMHRLVLHPFYAQNQNLWRPLNQLNVVLIYVATFTLIAIFIGMYGLLISPKSLGMGLSFGAFLGLALGIGSGLGTYIHMPIPRALAWGWLIGGWLKGIAAGAILGLIIA